MKLQPADYKKTETTSLALPKLGKCVFMSFCPSCCMHIYLALDRTVTAPAQLS